MAMFVPKKKKTTAYLCSKWIALRNKLFPWTNVFFCFALKNMVNQGCQNMRYDTLYLSKQFALWLKNETIQYRWYDNTPNPDNNRSFIS